MLTKREALVVLKHLIKTEQAFCFVNGIIIDREQCKAVLTKNNKQTA